LRLASYAGYMPDFTGCSECGKEKGDYFYFRPDLGDIVCQNCRGEYGIKIAYDVLSALRYIVSAGAKRIFSFKISDEGLKQLSGITENYILICFERQLKSLEYYRKIIK
jgi:DNA repair protein RecO (recombination protein O)